MICLWFVDSKKSPSWKWTQRWPEEHSPHTSRPQRIAFRKYITRAQQNKQMNEHYMRSRNGGWRYRHILTRCSVCLTYWILMESAAVEHSQHKKTKPILGDCFLRTLHRLCRTKSFRRSLAWLWCSFVRVFWFGETTCGVRTAALPHWPSPLMPRVDKKIVFGILRVYWILRQTDTVRVLLLWRAEDATPKIDSNRK